MERQLYYVSQSHYGHEYVWIYDDESLLKAAGKEIYECIQDWLKGEDSTCIDILFPMGGSNSSATYIVKLNSEEEARDYLLKTPACCEDYENPMLVDIAEYIRTINTDEGSITQEILDKYNLKAEDLEQFDYRYDELIELGIKPDDFYEDRRDDRYWDVIEELEHK